MDIKLNTTFTLFQPGRETLDPSYFLLHFVDVDQDEQRFAIVQNEGEARGPLLFRVTEMEAGNPTLGQVQLYAANWHLTVYEQTSATNQDIASAGRKVWSELIGVCEVEGTPAREPYDPCIGCGEGPCPPTTVNGTESDTETITVVQGGEQVGTLNPATGVHTVPECEPCPPCDPQLELRLNDGRVYKTLDLDCGLQGYDNVVTYPDGTPVGEWNAEEDRIEVPAPDPCDPCPLGYTLQDSADNVLLSGIINDPCDDPSLLLTAPDGSFQRKDSAGTNIGSPIAVRSGQSGVVATCPDATIRSTDGLQTVGAALSNANFDLPQTNILYTDAANALAALGPYDTKFATPNLQPATILPRVTIYESDGVTVQGYADVANPFYTVDACPSLCTLLGDVEPANAQTQILDCVDEATEDAIRDILAPPGDAIIYNIGRSMFSGQETVYRTGDEGSMFAAGFFNYNPTIGPNTVLARLVDFFTLAENNIFGNTLRFTDRAGAAAASSGDRFIQDHYVGVEYYVLNTWLTAADWDAAVDAGVAINATLGETGWFLPNDRLIDNATNDNSAAFASGAPFSMPGTQPVWTSSTVPGNTAAAKFLSLTGGQLGASPKTTSIYIYGIFVRRFI